MVALGYWQMVPTEAPALLAVPVALVAWVAVVVAARDNSRCLAATAARDVFSFTTRKQARMAYFAGLDSENVVQQVVVVADEDCGGGNFPLSEQLGQEFIAGLGFTGIWKQTSDSGSFRKQYAGIGYCYNTDADVFVAPQPYPSWTLDTDCNWQPPTAMPEKGMWMWDEETLAWIPLS